MHKLDANELFGTTLYTFNRIMEVGGKNGPDAFALYFRLMQQARIQQTNQTLSNNQFLMKAMGRGQDRLTKANKILKELGLIDRVQATRGGKIVGVYVRVNFLIDEDKVRTSYTTYNINLDEIGVQNEEVSGIGENLIQENLDSGETITNAGSIKEINAGSIKEKELLLHNNSKAEEIQETTLLSIEEDKEKEKNSAKKEKESYGREDINYLIEQIKIKCNILGVMYDKTKEREFAKHILTAKEYGENCERCGMNRVDFAINIIQASKIINYYKGICNGPMSIYQYYVDVYNRYMQWKEKQNKMVGFLPGIKIQQGQN